MNDEAKAMSKADCTVALHLAGFSQERIAEILADLPDPFDAYHEEEVLARHGVTRNQLTDARGGSL
jgi:hypothetical protein